MANLGEVLSRIQKEAPKATSSHNLFTGRERSVGKTPFGEIHIVDNQASSDPISTVADERKAMTITPEVPTSYTSYYSHYITPEVSIMFVGKPTAPSESRLLVETPPSIAGFSKSRTTYSSKGALIDASIQVNTRASDDASLKVADYLSLRRDTQGQVVASFYSFINRKVGRRDREDIRPIVLTEGDHTVSIDETDITINRSNGLITISILGSERVRRVEIRDAIPFEKLARIAFSLRRGRFQNELGHVTNTIGMHDYILPHNVVEER